MFLVHRIFVFWCTAFVFFGARLILFLVHIYHHSFRNMNSTISNPFFADLNDPKFKSQIDKMMLTFQTRRPSTTNTKNKLVSLNAKIDKHRIQFEKLMEEIPELMVEIILWQKYQQHKEQQDQQKLAVVEEETRLRQAELELEKKKVELSERKRISTKRAMLGDTTPTLGNFQVASNKIQIFVKDLVGKSHPVEVVASSTIDELFNYVFSGFKDVPKEDCALRTDTKALELGKTFAEQGVEASSTIHMFIRQRGGGKKKLTRRSHRRVEVLSRPTLAAKLLFANEDQLDYLFKKIPKDDSDVSVSLGDDSERSGADEEYKRGKDPDYVPSEDEDDEGDDFDDCQHEWLNAVGICFDCGAEVGAHPTIPDFPTTPFQPKEKTHPDCEWKLCLGDHCECPQPPPDADESLKQVICDDCVVSKFQFDYIFACACGDDEEKDHSFMK